VICADCDAFVPQGESALGLSTQGTLICASFKTMSRIINIVFAGMTTFIEVRIANYLYIAMFLPNKLLPEYGCESLFVGELSSTHATLCRSSNWDRLLAMFFFTA